MIGLPDDRWGEIVAAVVCVDGNHGPGLKSEIADFVGARLTHHKVPTRWFIADGMPTTPTGKIRKIQLQEAVLAGQFEEL